MHSEFINLPRVKSFAVDKCGVVVIADIISVLRLSGAAFGDEVSVHDYISYHRTGVALRRRPRSEEEKCNAADEHLCRIASNNLRGFKTNKQKSVITAATDRVSEACGWMGAEGRGCRCGAGAAVSECCKRGQSPGWCADFSPEGRNVGVGSGERLCQAPRGERGAPLPLEE